MAGQATRLMPTISFITANYVARARDYDGVENWGYHDWQTVRSASLSGWAEVIDDVKRAGFMAADLWMAHCHYQHHTPQYRDAVLQMCQENNLKLTSYAGGLNLNAAADAERALTWVRSLGIDTFAGGLWGKLAEGDFAPAMNDLFAKYGVRWAYENHPEKSVEEILKKIGGGRHRNIGVALDTGWCGTQGMDALDALKRLREHVFLLHLKDVKAPGRHDTCTLGDGCVGVEAIVRYLKETKFDGTICIEHEPYDHDPTQDIIESVKRVEQWMA
jgi:L-ribulose-5-phosphate 3-epimerase